MKHVVQINLGLYFSCSLLSVCRALMRECMYVAIKGLFLVIERGQETSLAQIKIDCACAMCVCVVFYEKKGPPGREKGRGHFLEEGLINDTHVHM